MQGINRLLRQIDAGLVLAALLSLLIGQSLLQPGLPTTADLVIHLYRTLEYGQSWAPGVIVPRWAPNLAYGYGYPLFVFAPPLPYLLGLALYAVGLSLETAFKVLLMLTMLGYTVGMYLLARDMLNSATAGLVAAAAFTFAPFALREALLYGGNLPQLMAIGFFPWTLWAMNAAIRRRTWSWVIWAGLFYAGIMLSHLFQVLIFTPVVGLYGLLLGLEQWRAEGTSFKNRPGRVLATVRPLAALPLGLLLSAFFWLPALTERVYTRAQADVYLVKSPFFVRYPHPSELAALIEPLDGRAANPYVPLTLGVVTLALASLGLLAALLRPGRRLARSSLFFALVAAGAVFMALPPSRPIWEIVTILQVAEFPWRMLGLANLGLAFLAGAALLLAPTRWRPGLAAACLLVQLAAVAPFLYPVIPFTRYERLTLAEQIDYERRSQSIGTTTLGEYLPQTVRQVPTTSPLFEAFRAGENPERLDRTSLPAGATAIRLEQNAVTHRYALDSPTPFTLRLFQFHYPGWQASLGDRAIAVRPETETGLLLVDIPAGAHTLTVSFGETPIRLISLGLTGLTLAGLGLTGLLFGRRGLFPSPPVQSAPEPRLTLVSPGLWLAAAALLAGAFWLKPLLRPVFTLESPPGEVLPAGYPADVRFEQGIRLVGYDLSRQVVPAGGYLRVVLYWETDRAPLEVNLQPFVHLDRLNDFTTVADATNYTPGDPTTESNMPTFHWDTERYVRDEHDFLLPPDLPPRAYAVRVGLINPHDGGRLLSLGDGSGDTAWLATINVAPGRDQPAELAQPLAVTLTRDADTIRLVGFELEGITPARLDFTLAWQASRPPRADYTVFAQLLNGSRLVAGFDRPPLDGAYPTSTWLPGQVILDLRSIPLDNVPPGQYRLVVGLYHPETGQRMRTAEGADTVELTTVTLGNQR